MLVAQGIMASEPAIVLPHPALPAVCEALADRAEQFFAEAAAAMAECPRAAMRPAALMGAVYGAVLARLRRRGWTRLDEPVEVPKPVKLWLALRHGLL
jgi:presqualene diphosphate synthase